jgi:hypothetical protein
MKIVSGAFFALALSVALSGCNAKEQPQGNDMKSPHGTSAHANVPKRNLPILVPDFVKGKWKGVRLAITDKNTGKSTECDVPLETGVVIPGTGLQVIVKNFLPHFSMGADIITSTSNEAKNPAVQATISDGKKEIFNGWLFQMFPAVHAFQHPKYGITLLSGIPAD